LPFFSERLAKSTEPIEKGNGEKFMNRTPKIVSHTLSDTKSDRPALQARIVRGYDSRELFRKDLWLRRIDQSRKRVVVAKTSMRLMTTSEGVGEEDGKRICAMLAQYASIKLNN